MPATATDRLYGLTTSVAVKPPCRVAATANLALTGLQVVSSVQLVEGDRVLLTGQTNAVDNGIWLASTSAWQRAPDFDGPRDAVRGTMVITEFDAGITNVWQLVTPDPVQIGTSELEFQEFLTGTIGTLSFTQSGAGAVVRGAQAKMREVISVLDFGAVADGSFVAGGAASGTDNLAAFNSALAAAALLGKNVHIPGGQYYLSAGYTLPRGVTMFGDGCAHAPLYLLSAPKRGTVLLINGANGADCVTFEENGSHSALAAMSIYNVNTNSIRSVVGVVGHLYPRIGLNVEIASLRPTNGAGIYISTSVVGDQFETLWGDFFGVVVQIGDIGLSTEYSVATGVRVYSQSTVKRPNTNNFFGGNLQGKTNALHMDGAAADSGAIGCAFHGVRFDTVYSNAVVPTYVASANAIVEFPIQNVYTYPCVTLSRALSTALHGCYFEVDGLPATYNDGVNGVHPIIGVVHLTSSTQVRRTVLDGCAYNGCYVRDQGAATRVTPTNSGYEYDTSTKNLLVVRANGVQTVPSGVNTAVDLNTVLAGDDAFISWDTATNVATVYVDGVYQISGRVEFDGWDTISTGVRTRVTAGGVEYRGSFVAASEPPNPTPISSVISVAVQLFRGDTIAFQVLQNEGNDQDTTGAASDTWLSIAKL